MTMGLVLSKAKVICTKLTHIKTIITNSALQKRLWLIHWVDININKQLINMIAKINS